MPAASRPPSLLSRALAVIRRPDRRALLRMRLFARTRLHQTTPFTRLDRYPEIFGAVRTLLADIPSPRILSFGCSTGEEAVTLRRYFPAAAIVGAEINAHSLAVCRALPRAHRLVFVASTPTLIARHGPYDAIFCMAVLQRTPHLVARDGIADISRLYPFARFERQLAALDRVLAPGGLLVIEHSQYGLADTVLAARYAASDAYLAGQQAGPRFDRHGRRAGTGAGQPVIFVKRGCAPRASGTRR